MKLNNTVVRRVVTGHNEAGKSVVLVDDTTEPVDESTVNSTRIWSTDSQPPKTHTVAEVAAISDFSMEPPGSNFLLLFVPPDDPDASMEEMERQWAERFANIGAAHIRVDTSKHPRMHLTRTIDYLVVLSGEVTLLLDEEEVVLKPFDTIVQQATNHGWINRTKEPAVMAVIMTGQDLT